MMYGADADELEQIAGELDAYRDELGQLLREGVGAVSLLGLSATLNSVWLGPRAGEFAGIWQSRHLLRIRDVQATLEAAASDLRKNAAEQVSASTGRPAPSTGHVDGSVGGSDADEGTALDYLDELALALGISGKALDALYMALRALDSDAALAFGRFFTDHAGMFKFAQALKAIADPVDALVTFIQDFGQQYSEGLPLDEVVVHASLEMVASIGVDVGLKKVCAALGAAVAGFFTAGVATPAGAAVGWFVGELTSFAAKEAIEAFDGFERYADHQMWKYRLIKSGAEFVVDATGQVVEIAGEAVNVVVDGGQVVVEVVGDVTEAIVDGVVDLGENLIDGTGDAIESVGGFFGRYL